MTELTELRDRAVAHVRDGEERKVADATDEGAFTDLLAVVED